MGVTRVKDLEKPKEEKKKKIAKPTKVERKIKDIVRLADTDVDATKPMVQSLRSIRGISHAMARAICQAAGFSPSTRLNELSPEQLEHLENVIKEPGKFGIPSWLLNRRKDPETGKDLHLTGAQLGIATKLDIKRLVDLKTWHGMRHSLGLPVRGQRTKSHFRGKGTVGVMKKAVKLLLQKAEQEKKK